MANPVKLNLDDVAQLKQGGLRNSGNGDNESNDGNVLKSQVVVPSQDDIEKVVLEEKKKSLMEKYLT